MTNASHTSACPSPDRLAAFAEGRLSGNARDEIVAHLDACEECAHEVGLAMQAIEEDGVNVARPRRWQPWLAAVAAAIVAVVLFPLIRSLNRSPIDRLVAASPKSARVVEPRLTGGFAWSPYHGTPRAAGSANADPARMKLIGAAGELVEQAQHDAGADAQHGAGVALLLTQNSDEAIARLEAATHAHPSAPSWSDLAAARYAAASDVGRAALYPQALAAADAALRLDADLPEALFNRALILGRMGLAAEARAAWQRYLAVDPSSRWADEARVHLSELPDATKSSRFDRDRPLLEAAAARGDLSAARGLLVDHVAHVLALAEVEYLGRWGEAAPQKNDGEATHWLTVARNIAAAAGPNSIDTLLRDAVKAIDDATVPQRDVIASAHAAYRMGRLAYSKHQLDDAARELGRAASLFAQGGSPMALAARFYAASVRQAKNEPHAGAELERVLADVDANPGYLLLRAHVRWETGRARMFDYNWHGAASLLANGAAMFRQAGDRVDEAAMESLLAYCYAAAGSGDPSWSARILALQALSIEGNPTRLGGTLAGAVRAERLAGRNDAALALARLPQPVTGDAEQLAIVLDALQIESLLESTTGDAAGALRSAKRAAMLARSVADPSLRARRLADADVAAGAAMAVSDPASALAPLERAIAFYRRGDVPFALPEPLLLHARCERQRGNAAAAMSDLEEGMSIIERHRPAAGGTFGTGILDADRALFHEAIRLQLDRGDDAAAFAIAERSRGAAITIAELQQRLIGSGAAVLEIVAMPGELVLFAIADHDLQVARHSAELAVLQKLAGESLAEHDTRAAAALYDQLVRPVAGVIDRAKSVVVVPDPMLECVPFGALYDQVSRAYVIERTGVAIAASAAALQRESAGAATSIATIALPTDGTAGMRALPEAADELREIASLYRRATAISAGEATLAALRQAAAANDIVHVAGHTERQLAGGEAALLLAEPDGAALERASSRVIATMPPPHARLIVLAACETLRPPASVETHALSFGGAFVAAGAPNVIGTLTPIGDRDAHTFFRALHRYLAAGSSPSAALRATQIAALHEERRSGESQAWKSISLVTSRIPTDERRGGS